MSLDEFFELLMQTKEPKFFAESAIKGKGIDWNNEELSILGDVNIAVPVKIYDNGVHRGDGIQSHASPIEGELLYIPAALLKSGNGFKTPGMEELLKADGCIDDEAFYKLYERRLLPSLIHASDTAGDKGAIVTIPGMGCGAFAGHFAGQLEAKIKISLEKILDKHKDKLTNLKGLVFDPNNIDGLDGETQIGNTKFITKAGHFGKDSSQLKHPHEYKPEFADCKLYSIVAWDHVSWPGNDFYAGNARSTDDGVKCAATDTCAVMTGLPGEYDHHAHKYLLPKEWREAGWEDWEQVIKQQKIELHSKGNTTIVSLDGSKKLLSEISSSAQHAGGYPPAEGTPGYRITDFGQHNPGRIKGMGPSHASGYPPAEGTPGYRITDFGQHDPGGIKGMGPSHASGYTPMYGGSSIEQARQSSYGVEDRTTTPSSLVYASRAEQLQTPPKKITMYSAKQNEEEGFKPRLAIEFENIKELTAFTEKFNGIKMTKLLKGNHNVIYIEPSEGVGSTGTYKSADGELSIAFKTQNQRDAFCSLIGITTDYNRFNMVHTYELPEGIHALAPSGVKTGLNALYFNPEILPEKPDRSKSIKTTAPSLVEASQDRGR